MPLDPDDYQLSMRISKRGRFDPPSLRSLIVHRLSVSMKMVLRRPLKDSNRQFGLYCEQCDEWTHTPHVDGIVTCNTCQRQFRVEMVIYEEIERDE